MDVLEKVKALQINMGQLGGACAKAGVAFGTVGALAGSALKSMITGNLWELGATGLRWVIDEYDLLGRKAAAAAEEAKRAWEDALDGIGRRAAAVASDGARELERISRAAKAEAEEASVAREKIYAGIEIERQRQIAAGGSGRDADREMRRTRAADARSDAQAEALTAAKRVRQAEENYNRVLKNTVNARVAARAGRKGGLDAAEKALADARTALEDERRRLEVARARIDVVELKNRAEDARAENDYRKEDEQKAAELKRKEEEAARKAEKEAAERRRKDEEAARKAEKDELQKKKEAQKKTLEAMRREAEDIDARIKAAKKRGDTWEEGAAKLRGRTFSDVERERRDTTRNGPSRFDRENAADVRRAERLETDIRRGIGVSRKSADWLKRFRTWQAAQDPANNKAANEAERLENERRALQQKMQRTLEAIHNDLTAANTVG